MVRRPRLICIAGDFNRYDDHAVKQIHRNIELIRYRRLAASSSCSIWWRQRRVKARADRHQACRRRRTKRHPRPLQDHRHSHRGARSSIRDRYEALRAYLLALGDDVQETTLRFYIAFKRIKNFACVEFRPTTGRINLFVKVDPASITLEPGFTRDVSNVGHFGTGDLEISLSKSEDLGKSLPR